MVAKKPLTKCIEHFIKYQKNEILFRCTKNIHLDILLQCLETLTHLILQLCVESDSDTFLCNQNHMFSIVIKCVVLYLSDPGNILSTIRNINTMLLVHGRMINSEQGNDSRQNINSFQNANSCRQQREGRTFEKWRQIINV